MPALLELQRSFAASLLSDGDRAAEPDILDGGFSAGERLRIYRNTCRSALIETLRMTYPAVDRLVGREFFDMAADRFVLAHPARSGYLNEYGGGFADFLAGFQPASSLPYLADVARFEWALSVAANAEDAPVLTADALVAVQAQHQGALCFEPHPSVSVLLLAYPADRIADAVLSGNEAAMAEVDLASGPVHLVVHRGPAGLEPQRLGLQAFAFISHLCAGESLRSLIEIAGDDASKLLAEQFLKGRLTAFRIAQ